MNINWQNNDRALYNNSVECLLSMSPLCRPCNLLIGVAYGDNWNVTRKRRIHFVGQYIQLGQAINYQAINYKIV